MEDSDYLRVISDALIPGEMPITANQCESDSDSDVTDNDTQGQCVQQQRCQHSSSATRADSGTYMTVINDRNDHGYDAIVIADSDLTDSVSTLCILEPLHLNVCLHIPSVCINE